MGDLGVCKEESINGAGGTDLWSSSDGCTVSPADHLVVMVHGILGRYDASLFLWILNSSGIWFSRTDKLSWFLFLFLSVLHVAWFSGAVFEVGGCFKLALFGARNYVQSSWIIEFYLNWGFYTWKSFKTLFYRTFYLWNYSRTRICFVQFGLISHFLYRVYIRLCTFFSELSILFGVKTDIFLMLSTINAFRLIWDLV